jgi:putative spermidine/putrescine transport system permease protein
LRRTRWLALALAAPLALLLGAGFLAPVGFSLATAIADRELRETLPRTAALLRAWDGEALPGEAAFAALATEAGLALSERRLGGLAQRLNFERPGLRAALLRVARAAPELAAPYTTSLPALDPRWADPATWRLLRDAARGTTSLYLLRALDLERSEAGITRLPPEQSAFRLIFARTLWIALCVTALCLALGYPLALFIAALPRPWSAVALTLVLIPFWSSALTRSVAWFALLQREGPVNDALLALGLLDAPAQLIGTRIAVLIATVHVLLPFAVLPMHAVLARLDPALARSAASLGGSPAQVFARITWPLSKPGVAAGGAMVFLLAIGFYITPALLGGPRDQMISWFVGYYINTEVNWGMAAALSAWLLLLAGAVLAAARVVFGAGPRALP